MDRVVEFGGGIGPATEAGGKRPNLQGMIKSVLRAGSQQATYSAVISTQSLDEAAGQFTNTQ